jgi:hypothetical protein
VFTCCSCGKLSTEPKRVSIIRRREPEETMCWDCWMQIMAAAAIGFPLAQIIDDVAEEVR